MMRAWSMSGTRVSLATSKEVQPEAINGITLESTTTLSAECRESAPPFPVSGLLQRFIRYWGISLSEIQAMADITEKIKPDAVVASGLDALPFLYRIQNCIRVWYAADEGMWHHLSQFSFCERSTWREIKAAIINGLYERTFRSFCDRIWVVSNADCKAMRIVSGVRNIDVIPNGVDNDYFHPLHEQRNQEKSLVFWGRLDFGPNIQGLQWFCRNIWPALYAKHSEAVFNILGAKPIADIHDLGKKPGIRILPDLDDLRPEIARNQVVVLPFISGGGIKNKLLEAAAMGMPVVCTKRVSKGLNGRFPAIVATSKTEWITAIEKLWNNQAERESLGLSARNWVQTEHTWKKAASNALMSIHNSHGTNQI
jgi:glycosyltransferase involved in cell wall biosynthesis